MLVRVIAACLALAACGMASSDSTRIDVSPTSFTMDEGTKQVVTFEIHQPIICPEGIQKECNVVILLTNTHPEQIHMDTCFVKWRWDEWNQKRRVTISAKEDFVDDKEQTFKIITEPIDSPSLYFNGQNPKDIVMKTRPRPSGACKSTGDPHITSFDGFYYHVYQPGRFVFYKSTTRNFEVQTDTYSFHRPAVQCAVAVREDNDIVVISLCKDGFTPQYRRDCGSARCAAGGFPKVGITGGSMPKYVIQFASGAMVEAHVHYWSAIRKRYMNIYTTAPGKDYGNTVGLCGTFDKNTNNDANVRRNGWIRSMGTMYNNQKVTDANSIFDWYPSTSSGLATPAPRPAHAEECKYVEEPYKRPILGFPDIEDLTNILKDSFKKGEKEAAGAAFELDSYAEFDEEQKELSDAEARTMCAELETHHVVDKCRQVWADFDFAAVLEGCVEDMIATGGERELMKDALEALSAECAEKGNRDLESWEKDNNGKPKEPSQVLQNAICLNDCSGNGKCVKTKCVCNAGFEGQDCSQEIGAKPVLEKIPDRFCAINVGNGAESCKLEVAVFGRNLHNSKNLKCKIGSKEMPAIHVGDLEVVCQLPPHQLGHAGAQELTKEVRVTTDGKYWSNALTYTWYDAVCQVCTEKEGCKPNPNACTIDGKCYLATEVRKENPCQKCVPATSPSVWSFDFSNALECGPIGQRNVETQIGGDTAVVTAGTVFYTLNNANPLVKGDPAAKITYIIADEDEKSFQIDANTGEISAAVDLEIAKLPENFKNFFKVRAMDGAGNEHMTHVYVNVIEINVSPLFPQEINELPPVKENVRIGTVIGRVEAHDSSKDEAFNKIKYTFITNRGEGEMPFRVNSASGDISVILPLNFEKEPKFELHLLATDGGGQSHSTKVVIQVTDVPEAPTALFLDGDAVAESADIGTVVGTLSAEDEDKGETFTYAVAPLSAPFKCDGNKLVLSQKVDYEALEDGVLKISITVTDSKGKTLAQDFEITVSNTNEPPTAPTLSTTTVKENAKVGSPVANVLSSDPDGDKVGCTLTDDANGIFEINAGKLVLLKKLDFETRPTFTIKAVCVDDGTPVLRSEQNEFKITVTNANDAPSITGDLVAVPENAANFEVGTVKAIDVDNNADAFVMGVSAASSKLFKLIDQSCARDEATKGYKCTAKLVALAPLDHEANGGVVYAVIEAADGNQPSLIGSASLEVRVTDVPEPVTGVAWIGGTRPAVAEGTPKGTVVGQLEVLDEDEEQSYSVEIISVENGDRTISATSFSARRTGDTVFDIVVEDSSALDHKSNGGDYALKVTVTTTDARNAKEAPASFSASLEVVQRAIIITWPGAKSELRVPESAAVGTVLATFSVVGGANGAPWTTNVAGDKGHFEIEDGSTTAPKLVLKRALDFEAGIKLSAEIVATSVDAAGARAESRLSAVPVVVVNVDFPPVFSKVESVVKVHPDESVGYGVTRITATPGEPSKLSVAYAITQNMVFNALAIDSKGRITLRRNLDGIAAGEYDITVRAAVGAAQTSVKFTLVVTSRDCDSDPCGSEGTCEATATAHTCVCNEGYTGPDCSQLDAVLSASSDGGSNDASASALGGGALAGIIIGCLLAVCLVVLLATILLRRRNDRAASTLFESTKENGIDNPMFVAPNAAGGPQQAQYDAISFTQKEPAPLYATAESGMQDSAMSNPMYDFIPGHASPMYSWYRPNMTRADATEELMACGEGAFLVRDSKATPGWHMLGVKTSNTVVHEKIRGGGGTYELVTEVASSQQPNFDSIPELVDFYSSPSTGVPWTLMAEQPIYDNNQLVEVRHGSFIKGEARQVLQSGPSLPQKAMTIERRSGSMSNDTNV